MSKKALGRGLNELLPEGGSPVLPRVASKNQDGPVELGPGLRVLVVERNGGLHTQAATTQIHSTSTALVVKLSLVAADILLLGSAFLCLRSFHPDSPSAWRVILALVLVAFGAWLGCLAAWLHLPASSTAAAAQVNPSRVNPTERRGPPPNTSHPTR